jgi:hypothetical protein
MAETHNVTQLPVRSHPIADRLPAPTLPCCCGSTRAALVRCATNNGTSWRCVSCWGSCSAWIGQAVLGSVPICRDTLPAWRRGDDGQIELLPAPFGVRWITREGGQ